MAQQNIKVTTSRIRKIVTRRQPQALRESSLVRRDENLLPQTATRSGEQGGRFRDRFLVREFFFPHTHAHATRTEALGVTRLEEGQDRKSVSLDPIPTNRYGTSNQSPHGYRRYQPVLLPTGTREREEWGSKLTDGTSFLEGYAEGGWSTSLLVMVAWGGGGQMA